MVAEATVTPDQLQQVDTSVLKLKIELPEEWRTEKQVADVPWDQLTRFTSLQSLAVRSQTGKTLPLAGIPAEVFTLATLQSLDIWSCGLQQVSHELSQLTALTSLSLIGCLQQDLPAEVGSLGNLQDLGLNYCRSLLALPCEVSLLTALTSIDVSGCDALPELPSQLSALTALRHLHARECQQLCRVPVELCQLPNLENLQLWGCNSLSELPEEISGLTALTYLDLVSCQGLTEFPVHVCGLASLLQIELQYNRFVHLPDEFSRLTALTSLDLGYCSSLAALPESFSTLQRLVYVGVADCTGLTDLPVCCCGMANLQELDLSHNCCVGLPDAFGSLTALTKLDLQGCVSLATLPESFGNLQRLVCLDVEGCEKLTWQGLPLSCSRLTALQELHFLGCPSFEPLCSNSAYPLAYVRAVLIVTMNVMMTNLLGRCCVGPLYKVFFDHNCYDTTNQGYNVLCKALRPVQRRKLEQRRLAQQAAATKLATQQDTMLTTLERMSWLVVLLATTTFIAYLQPPGGLEKNQVITTSVGSCFAPSSELLPTQAEPGKGLPGFMQCSMLLFFIFDGLSFGLSVGCLVLIVMLSMPRIPWECPPEGPNAEAGRFYVLLLSTWLLLYLAVGFGFAAFIASGLAVHQQSSVVIGPVVPGMVLLLLGAYLFLRRFRTLYPGWGAIWAARPWAENTLAAVEPLPPPPTDVELGQAQFWREWPQYFGHLRAGAAAGGRNTAS